MAAVKRETRAPRPAASFLSPNAPVSSPVSKGPGSLPSVWSADKPADILLPLPDTGKLWSGRFGARLNGGDGGGGTLDFMSKKAESDAPGAIDVSKVADIGAACRLLENDDTKLRGAWEAVFRRSTRV